MLLSAPCSRIMGRPSAGSGQPYPLRKTENHADVRLRTAAVPRAKRARLRRRRGRDLSVARGRRSPNVTLLEFLIRESRALLLQNPLHSFGLRQNDWPSGDTISRGRWGSGQFGASAPTVRRWQKSLVAKQLAAPKIRRFRRRNCPPLFTALYTEFEKVSRVGRMFASRSVSECNPPRTRELAPGC
jgi:hypothetical protein